jgi:hypothetical protein
MAAHDTRLLVVTVDDELEPRAANRGTRLAHPRRNDP